MNNRANSSSGHSTTLLGSHVDDPDLCWELVNAPRPFKPAVGAVVVIPGGKLVLLSDWQVFVAAVLAWHRLALTLRSFPDESPEEVEAEPI